ncbi:hypothetical protein MPSEU_000836300 [Mayamaea pseudoterrestris]|nr:hypothetical protein MPSEU_000836300 [Mayamaea pseudoterrestris]
MVQPPKRSKNTKQWLSSRTKIALSCLLLPAIIKVLNDKFGRNAGESNGLGALLLLQEYASSALTTSHEKSPSDAKEPIKIAHVTSIIICKNEARVRGMMDALAVLRHSIHENSVHAHPNSKYSYQMYAILHEDNCNTPQILTLLKQLGYIALIKPTPVNVSAVRTDWYSTHVEGENCCGSAEFIKLYAYTLMNHPIYVHWDLDTAVLQPLDDLYDAILFDKDSPQGQAARSRIRVQRPHVQKIPDRIDAFLTRDVTSATPWEKVQAVQGGFIVARPSLEHFEQYLDMIRHTEYFRGRGGTSGWGGLGYGGFQGAMAYQGVLAYFYDVLYKGHHVELDVCRYNQVVADVIWRGPDGSIHMHQCRDYPHDGNYTRNTPENGECEDCRILPVEETITAHYTACKKPWECQVPTPFTPRNKDHAYRFAELTNVTTCGKLFNKWFTYRLQLEQRIADKMGTSFNAPDGTFQTDFFRGYCKGRGQYVPMQSLQGDLSQVYGF